VGTSEDSINVEVPAQCEAPVGNRKGCINRVKTVFTLILMYP